MAETSASTNNHTIVYRGKTEREFMPSVSQAQNRFMHAVAEGKVEGVAPKVGRDFVKTDEGCKIRKLPKHVGKKARGAMKRGLISAKAAKRHLSEY